MTFSLSLRLFVLEVVSWIPFIFYRYKQTNVEHLHTFLELQ